MPGVYGFLILKALRNDSVNSHYNLSMWNTKVVYSTRVIDIK
jgi:hypothetical protein